MQKKLRILLVTHYYSTHRGGVEIVAGKLAQSLCQQREINIQWVASNTDPLPERVEGIDYLPIPANNWIEKNLQIPYPIWGIRSLFELWGAIARSDMIHLHDYLYMGNLIAFFWAKIQRKPILITQHIGFIPYKNPLFRGLLSFLNRTLGKFVLQRANRVVFISEVVQQYFAKQVRFQHPSVMIANGLDGEIFFPVDESKRQLLRQESGFSMEKPLFLFVGRFVEKKGLLIVQELVQRFPDINWVFAGWGSIAPESWNLDNVSVLRDRAQSTLTPLYQIADLLVLPSCGEGFPLVVQEAMACGTPVMVGSETAQAYSRAAHLMVACEVEGTDVIERWSEKIQQFLEKGSTQTQLRTDVADFAREHWSWNKTAVRYCEIFEKELGIDLARSPYGEA
ncbi:glycosyltransferase family 4 protein [Lusitaniella coriacea]|uniref:glycosyltransferase family 4 protein n=1 Tax=Lusitaniella coriacea TaxID=1983105 RepID=UPI003CF63384